MPKVKIKEIKKEVKIKEVKKEESGLEEEVKSEEFPSEEFIPSMHTPSIKSTPTVEEVVDRNPRIIREIPQEEVNREDLPEFSESARYNTGNNQVFSQSGARYSAAIQRSNFIQEVGTERQNNFVNTAERINPSIRSSGVFENQAQRSNSLASNSLVDNGSSVQNQYDHDLNKVAPKAKARLPWEI